MMNKITKPAVGKNSGFASLLEVVVTSVLVVIAAAGILTTISFTRPVAGDAAKRLEAVYAGRKILQRLNDDVNASTWGKAGNQLTPLGGGNTYTETVTVNGRQYVVNWTASDEGTNLRKVVLTVHIP
ncbi:MAG: hypothetical protein HQL23_01790 [Candidatus Omnitrophica bacterium]|nr:hypothetical protein [Candidatus Omnitrophota bacterium]